MWVDNIEKVIFRYKGESDRILNRQKFTEEFSHIVKMNSESSGMDSLAEDIAWTNPEFIEIYVVHIDDTKAKY